MSGNNWWQKTTQLRDIKDPTILNHQIAKQQVVFLLRTSIKHSILPDVIAQLILSFIVTKQLFKDANNNKLHFKLRTVLLSPLRKISKSNNTIKQNLICWNANYKKCVGMEFKLKHNITICGIELDLFFGGVQCYAVLSQYKKTKNKAKNSNKSLYKNTFHYKLIPCDGRQKIQTFGQDIYANERSLYNKCQMIFTEINKLNNGGLKLSSKNTIYKLGFIISDGFYCNGNDYVNLKSLNKKGFAIDEKIKCANWRLLNKSKLLGKQSTYYAQGLVEGDETSNALKWFPKIRFLTF